MSDDPAIVEYRGTGTVVRLDLNTLTLTLAHSRRSPHSGLYTVPLIEVVNIDYHEREHRIPGWARVRTATGDHSMPPDRDPYSWRSGGDHLKPFVLLAYFVARQLRHRDEARVTRDVLVGELHDLRQMIDQQRGE